MDGFYYWLSKKLPKRLVYWCAIRVGCSATRGKYANEEVPALNFMDAINRWEM